jgi:hypothetical protein
MNFTEGDSLDAEPRKVVAIDIICSAWTEDLHLTCNIWLTIEKLKIAIREQRGVSEIDQNLFWCNGMVEDFLFLNEITEKIKNSEEIDFQKSIQLNLEIVKVHEPIKKLTLSSNPQIDSLVQNISKALVRNIKPLKKNLGLSGLYQLKNTSRSVVAFFKPIDEEPVFEEEAEVLMTPNPESNLQRDKFRNSEVLNKFCNLENSNSNSSRIVKKSINIGRPSVRKGIYSGELAEREVAAYILDSNAVHCVPPTCLVEIGGNFFESAIECLPDKLVKRGSCQKFVANNGVVSNISFSHFSVVEVQKIAALDLRILNCDRNESNILFKRSSDNSQIELVPIDHGLSLPDTFEIYDSDLIWTTWSQAYEPIDNHLRKYILQLNPKEDSYKLKTNLSIRSNCLRNFRIAESFLQKAVGYDMTLGHISKMMYRKQDDVKSPLEKIVEQTEFIYRKICNTVGRRFYISNRISQSQFGFLSSKHWDSQTVRPRLGSYNLSPNKSTISTQDYQVFAKNSFFTCKCQNSKCCSVCTKPEDEKISNENIGIPNTGFHQNEKSHSVMYNIMSTTVSCHTPINPAAFNFQRTNFTDVNSNENTLAISKKTSLLDETKSNYNKNQRIENICNEDLYYESLNCHSQNDFKSNKENVETKLSASGTKNCQKKRIYLSDKSLTPILKPVYKVNQNSHNERNEFEEVKGQDCRFCFIEENNSNVLDEISELCFNPIVESKNPNHLQRSLSIQEKRSHDDIQMNKFSREEGSIVGPNSEEYNDELFFYFFESYAEQYLETLALSRHRRCSFNPPDFEVDN